MLFCAYPLLMLLHASSNSSIIVSEVPMAEMPVEATGRPSVSCVQALPWFRCGCSLLALLWE